MKQMKFDLNNNSYNNPLSSFHKHNHVFVKFAVCFLLTGLAVRLLFSSSIQFSSEVVTDTTLVVDNTLPPPATSSTVSGDFAFDESQTSRNVTAKCDIFMGDWIPDPSPPVYTNESCHLLEAHQNCMKNGRPDTGYLYWKWKPRDCELPKFNPRRFLDLMRNKSWAFIGDSILRNHLQSLVCTLSQVEQAVEIYHDKEYKSKTWHFPSHNFTLAVIWCPFLAKAAVFEDNDGVSSSEIQLHLDKLDTIWTEQYKKFDYVLLAGGKWFLKTAIYYENNTVVGCHSCSRNNFTELGFDHAYRKVLNLTFNFVTSLNHKAYIFFRTSTPDHFENGEWNTGGYCNRTRPFKEGEIDMRDVDAVMRGIELEEFEKAVAIGSKKGMNLKLLDTSHLSLLRPDGHPGVYRQFQPFAKDKNAKVQNDCLHWCLPGPIDSWNDLLMQMLVDD
ncbi:hypothetical protein F0562_015005 [Nyssa sinensis]|uniref:Uncharacterized protein n=1 Tax=Nyssa sinensis TaxID=561372 RepID=A0A5J4ZPA0_9ASTE|nr:hypothetical protein F0562_015005 [Nyssa sinensis]